MTAGTWLINSVVELFVIVVIIIVLFFNEKVAPVTA